MKLSYWTDIADMFMAPGDGGAGSGSVADDPPPTPGGDSGKPAADAGADGGKPGAEGAQKPPDKIGEAKDSFAEKAAKLAADEADKEGTPDGDDADGKPGAEGKPGEDGDADDKGELDDETKALVEEVLAETEANENILKTVDLWSSTLTPATKKWLVEGANELSQRKAADAADKGGNVDPDGKPLDGVAVKPLVIGKAYMTLQPSKLAELPPYNPGQIGPDWLKKFGVDPKAIHAPYADALAALMQDRNALAANAAMLHKESKSAFVKRDEAKGKLFEHEFSTALKDNGYEASQSSKALIGEVRKVAFKNGKQQPWAITLAAVSGKFPDVFKKKAADKNKKPEGLDTADATKPPPAAPAAPGTPAPPKGTRTTSAPAAKPLAPPKGITEGRDRFASRLKQKVQNGEIKLDIQ